MATLDQALTREGYHHVYSLIYHNRGTSFWLSDAMSALRRRDPVDALHDAETLYKLQVQRWQEIKDTTNPELAKLATLADTFVHHLTKGE